MLSSKPPNTFPSSVRVSILTVLTRLPWTFTTYLHPSFPPPPPPRPPSTIFHTGHQPLSFFFFFFQVSTPHLHHHLDPSPLTPSKHRQAGVKQAGRQASRPDSRLPTPDSRGAGKSYMTQVPMDKLYSHQRKTVYIP